MKQNKARDQTTIKFSIINGVRMPVMVAERHGSQQSIYGSARHCLVSVTKNYYIVCFNDTAIGRYLRKKDWKNDRESGRESGDTRVPSYLSKVSIEYAEYLAAETGTWKSGWKPTPKKELEYKALKADIARARLKSKLANEELGELLDSCPHNIVKDDDSADCSICGKHFGWWCPGSKTHLCEYGDDDPACDSCIHCGAPDERK